MAERLVSRVPGRSVAASYQSVPLPTLGQAGAGVQACICRVYGMRYCRACHVPAERVPGMHDHILLGGHAPKFPHALIPHSLLSLYGTPSTLLDRPPASCYASFPWPLLAAWACPWHSLLCAPSPSPQKANVKTRRRPTSTFSSTAWVFGPRPCTSATLSAQRVAAIAMSLLG